MRKLNAIDICAGGGGLTVGLKRAGFRVVSAVEISDDAIATYKANHRGTKIINKDMRKVSGAELLSTSPTGQIDVLAGCPPCQGFSSLTSKYKKTDARNALILEMARLIKEVRPTAVMMENVPGLAQKGKHLFKKFVDTLESLGYDVEWKILQVADFAVPQSRRRLVLVAGRGFKIPLPQPTHSSTGKDGLPKWKTLRSAIAGMPRPVTLKYALQNGGPQRFDWHVVRNLTPRNVRRLKEAHPGKSWTEIPRKLRPPCHQDRTAGFSNVYGRARWNQASPTITGGCTTLSKGRFGHPSQMRTFSVREAALIQTFPMGYVFETKFMDSVCQIIGNALPCDFAQAISAACMCALKRQAGLVAEDINDEEMAR